MTTDTLITIGDVIVYLEVLKYILMICIYYIKVGRLAVLLNPLYSKG